MEQGITAHSTVMPEGQDVERSLHRAIKNSGGATKLARALGISHQAVIKWRRLPAERVLDVERISKISRHDLRPDIYGTAPPLNTTSNPALDTAATKLLTGPAEALSVAAAIEGHRAAREALNAACPAQDEVALAAAGRDTSDEAMAPARAAWKAADEREVEAFEALLSCRPADPAGLAQMLAYIAESPALGDLDDSTDALRNIAAAAEAVAASGSTMHASADVIALAEAALAAFIECRRMDDELDAGRVTENEQEAALAQANAALEKLSRIEVKTWPDMALKCLVLGAEEMWDLNTRSDPSKDYRTTRIGRHFEAMVVAGVPANLSAPAAPVVDPIFPMIAEGRRLLAASETLHARPEADTPEGEAMAEGERTDALQALWDHVDAKLLKTVPLTAAGCRELSRFAVEYFQKNEVPISYDEQAVTGLIARSPFLSGVQTMQGDAAFLAIAPTLLPMLDRFDAMWAKTTPLYEAAEKEIAALGYRLGEPRSHNLPSWMAYTSAYDPAAELSRTIDDLVSPHMDTPATTLEGLILKARVAATLDHYEDDAGNDIIRLMKDRYGILDEPASDPEPSAKPQPIGRVQCSGDAHPDAYGLRVNEDGAGMHAPPGSTVIVEPVPPTAGNLAVAFMKKGGTPSIWHIGDSFEPDDLEYHPDSELFPQIEMFDPVTGRQKYIDCRAFEKLHRVQGVYVPVEVAQAYGPAPADLPILDDTPEGCLEHIVRDATNYPVLRTNDVALVDIGKTALEHGALCLIAWEGSGDRCGILQTNYRKMGSAGPVWCVDPINRPRGPGMMEKRQKRGGLLYASDGPYTPELLQPKIIGTIIGIRRSGHRVATGGQA